jgi:DNA helicase-2/ATP-dependent DNA helicase PcrA
LVENPSPILQGLNAQQLAAVTAPDGPVLVLAGPGSGKTRVLTHRIAYLLDEYEADPQEILAVTFTNKAAREMRERLDLLVGRAARGLTVGTFHSVCARILRRDGAPVGLGPDFVIYDDEDQLRLLRQAITEIGLDDKQYPPRTMQNKISEAKSKLLTPEEYTDSAKTYLDEVAGRVYRRYQELLEWNQAADFDDLLGKTVELWAKHPDVLYRYQERWRRVLVDEYQDTNLAQYTLIRLLTERRRSLFVVGDEDQGIYSWRAADITNILNFERDYPDATVLLLEQNYRSTQAILDVAMHVIGGNTGRRAKTLWTDKAGGIPVQVREAYDEQDEAQYICREVQRLVAGHGYRYSDIAVMYRTNAQSRSIEESFVRYRIPHVLVGGTRFYERKEIKDVLAYLRLVHNPYDTASLRRILEQTHSGRGVGKGTLAALDTYAQTVHLPLWDAIALSTAPSGREVAVFAGSTPTAQPPKLASKARTALHELVTVIEDLRERRAELPLPQLIDMVLQKTGYARALTDGSEEGLDRLENAKELISVAQDYAGLDPREALASFLEEVALLGDLDAVRESQDAVTLITLHAAKGLEYKVVFIAGVEEGLLPHSRSLDQLRALEEECRLAYVGVTRAMERLYISYAFHRTIFGATQTNEPSRFLQSIPGSLVSGSLPPNRASRRSNGASSRLAPQPAVAMPVRHVATVPNRPAAGHADVPAYAPGESVRHPRFGEGTVTQVRMQDGDQEVEVRFAAGATKRLIASLAKLEKV